jgi:hypothetical protein
VCLFHFAAAVMIHRCCNNKLPGCELHLLLLLLPQPSWPFSALSGLAGAVLMAKTATGVAIMTTCHYIIT